MTFRLRSRTRQSRRGLFEADDRRDALVNLGFVALIAVLGIGLLVAFGLAYYDQNLRPLARIGDREVSPGMVRDRAGLDQERLTRDEGRLRVLNTNHEIDTAAMNAAIQELTTRGEQLTPESVAEEVVDLLFQSQLAAEQQLVPSDADISAAVEREFTTPERRHFLVIAVKPETTGDAEPTINQRFAAIDRAKEALGKVTSGADWATVAKEYSSDPSAANGGDGGLISENNPTDPRWTDALFEQPLNGTTAIVASLGCARSDGGECLYRIGRVIEITAGGPDQGYRDQVMARLSADGVRQIIAWELAAERLRDKVTADATTGSVDQLHLAEIIVRNTDPGEGEEPGEDDATDAQGETHFSQILYAPKDDPSTAPDLPTTDPAWTTAENEAKTAYDELIALTDPQARSDRFAEIAKQVSDDDATKADGGDVDFTTRSLLPDAVGVALFDTEHQNGDLLTPVKDENGWYLLLFHEHRGTPAERLAQLKAEIAAGADWNTLVEKYSDAEEVDAAPDGDIGWYTREMLSAVEDEKVDMLFALDTGEVSEEIVFGTDSFIFKALEHVARELDPNQIAQLNDPDFGAYSDWYADKKSEAEANRVITRAGEEAPVPTDTAEPT